MGVGFASVILLVTLLQAIALVLGGVAVTKRSSVSGRVASDHDESHRPSAPRHGTQQVARGLNPVLHASHGQARSVRRVGWNEWNACKA